MSINFCGKYFERANTKGFIKTLASIQPKFVVRTPYLLCTEILRMSKISPEKTKTPSPKYSEMVFSDIFGSCY